MRSVLPYTAYLRVYQPIESFPPDERRHWEGYARSTDRPLGARALAAEQAEILGRLVATPPVPAPPEESQDAYLHLVEGRLYVCPWETRLRSWRAFAEFTEQVPPELSKAFVPEREAERVEDRYREWRASGARIRPGTLSSNWGIPIAWFVPFADGERRQVTSAGPTRALLYLTRVTTALERLGHIAAVLTERIGRHAVPAATEGLADWLRAVAQPGSLLELDYGGLVHLLDDGRLAEERSVAEVAETVEALAAGDTERVVELRDRLLLRWRSMRALEHAN